MLLWLLPCVAFLPVFIGAAAFMVASLRCVSSSFHRRSCFYGCEFNSWIILSFSLGPICAAGFNNNDITRNKIDNEVV